MKNFNWEEFMKGDIAVHCDTLEKANDFLRQCHDRGMKWGNNGVSLLDYNNWERYGENTCYEYDIDGIYFDDLVYYKEIEYKIVEWEIKEDMGKKLTLEMVKPYINDFNDYKYVIHCDTLEKANELFKVCDIHGTNNWNKYQKETCYYLYCYCNDNKIHWNFCSKNYYIEKYNLIVIKFDDLFNRKENDMNNKYELHIISNGVNTNCVYKKDGKIINKSNAKLNPIDKFDFKEGANLCVDRVFKDNIIKSGTKFRVLNVDEHREGNCVCLDAYIGQIGMFNHDCDLNNQFRMLSGATFEKEYINAIDKENGRLIWFQSEVEILED